MSRAAEFQAILSVLHTAQNAKVCKFVHTAARKRGPFSHATTISRARQARWSSHGQSAEANALAKPD